MSFLKKIGLKSFRHTVVALVWVSASIPVVILSVYQLRDDYEQRVATEQRDLEHQTDRASFAITQSLRQLMSDLDRIASDGSVIQSLSMPILSPVSVQKFGELLGNNTSAVSIMLIDKELFPIEVLPSMALLDDLTPYEEFMQQLVNSADSIRDPRPRLFIPKPGDSGQPQLVIARPILSASNSLAQPFQVKGLILVTLSLDNLVRELYAKTRADYELLRLFYDEDIIFEASRGQAVNLYKERANIALGRGEQSLAILLGSSAEDRWSKVLLAYRTQAIVAAMFIILMLIIVKRLADKLSLPLRLLSQLTAGMSANKFQQPAPVAVDTSAVHYEEFTEAFGLLRAMETTIGEQFKQLHEANTHLEDKVAARTEALEKNLRLLDQQKESLAGLVNYSMEIQQTASLEEAGRMTLMLAENICKQKIGAYVLRSEYFSGYQNFDWIAPEYRQFLLEHSKELNQYSSLLSLAKNADWLQFFPIGSSTSSYQGFLITQKTEYIGQTNETLMVLCTMLGSAIKQHNLTSKLDRLAHVDSVTHLHNRHYFTSIFNEKIRQFSHCNNSSHFAVFVIDVNGLKFVNDHYGHEQGDKMLKIVASAIKNVARANDTVARVGGDEFYILLTEANFEVCEKFSARLSESISTLSMTVDRKKHPVSFSFGFASTDLDSLKNLLTLADERMYFAKKKHYQSIADQ